MKYLTVVTVAVVVFLLTSAAIHAWVTLVLGVKPCAMEQLLSCLAAFIIMMFSRLATEASDDF